ncbi:MAG: DUF1501 domain-containing protein, partial [Myxococcota bacterium]
PSNPEDRESVETIAGIPLATNRFKRPQLAAFFERWGSRAAVINGLWVGAISHPACIQRVFTGQSSGSNGDMAALAAARVGLDAPVPYMDLSGAGITGAYAAYAGRTGSANQLEILLDRDTNVPGPLGSGLVYPGFTPEPSDASDLEAFLQARGSRMAMREGANVRTASQVDDLLESRMRADLLRSEGGGFADSLQLGRQSTLVNMAPTVRDLLSSGLCQTVSIDAGGNFDTHQDNRDQHAQWETAFTGIGALMQELEAGGLLSETVVVVVSEMTRTPRRNAQGGKDHWSTTSAMVLGAGVSGGRVVGGSTDTLDSRPVDLETGEVTANGVTPRYDNFVAGVLELVGVDPVEFLPNSEVYRGFHA